jgi:hypothetical protein
LAVFVGVMSGFQKMGAEMEKLYETITSLLTLQQVCDIIIVLSSQQNKTLKNRNGVFL